MRRSWAPYLLLLPVLGAVLFVGSRGEGGPPTTAQRVARIAEEVRCPTCEGLSAAESDTPASQAVREEVRRRVEAGESDDQIRAFLVSRYGKDILLKPESSGVTGLVWALPVVAVVVAGAGLVVAFRRWQARGRQVATSEDRAMVEQARRR